MLGNDRYSFKLTEVQNQSNIQNLVEESIMCMKKSNNEKKGISLVDISRLDAQPWTLCKADGHDCLIEGTISYVTCLAYYVLALAYIFLYQIHTADISITELMTYTRSRYAARPIYLDQLYKQIYSPFFRLYGKSIHFFIFYSRSILFVCILLRIH